MFKEVAFAPGEHFRAIKALLYVDCVNIYIYTRSLCSGESEHCAEQPGAAYIPDEIDESLNGESEHLPGEICK